VVTKLFCTPFWFHRCNIKCRGKAKCDKVGISVKKSMEGVLRKRELQDQKRLVLSSFLE